MRVPGYCTDCRRPRPVTATAHALSVAQARGGGVVEGVCVECEEREEFCRKTLRQYGHTWDSDFRIVAHEAGHAVRTVTFDPGWGWAVLLEDGREVESRTPSTMRAKLRHLPRRR